MSRKVIAVDLDGTLAKTTTDGRIGDPIKAMVGRVKAWQDDGIEVVLFTARAGTSTGLYQVKSWLDSVGLQDLRVTNVKDETMGEIWDNRAIRVETDTGEVCKACEAALKKGGRASSKHSCITDC